MNKLHDLIGRYKDAELSDYKPGTIRDNTMRGYRMYNDSYICPILGDKKSSAITSPDIQQMYAKRKKVVDILSIFSQFISLSCISAFDLDKIFFVHLAGNAIGTGLFYIQKLL